MKILSVQQLRLQLPLLLMTTLRTNGTRNMCQMVAMAPMTRISRGLINPVLMIRIVTRAERRKSRDDPDPSIEPA